MLHARCWCVLLNAHQQLSSIKTMMHSASPRASVRRCVRLYAYFEPKIYSAYQTKISYQILTYRRRRRRRNWRAVGLLCAVCDRECTYSHLVPARTQRETSDSGRGGGECPFECVSLRSAIHKSAAQRVPTKADLQCTCACANIIPTCQHNVGKHITTITPAH